MSCKCVYVCGLKCPTVNCRGHAMTDDTHKQTECFTSVAAFQLAIIQNRLNYHNKII